MECGCIEMKQLPLFSVTPLLSQSEAEPELSQNQRRQEDRPPLQAVRTCGPGEGGGPGLQAEGPGGRAALRPWLPGARRETVALSAEAAVGRPSPTSWLPVGPSRNTADLGRGILVCCEDSAPPRHGPGLAKPEEVGLAQK